MSLVINPYSFLDTDAQAFITAAGITDNTQIYAVNNLTINLKGYGIWTKMKAIYPFCGGSASSHKFNLRNPVDTDAAFRLVFEGGWTHSSTGALPNGTNAYADTKLNNLSNFTQNSTHFSYYSRTNSNGTEVEVGARVIPGSIHEGGLLEIRTSGITYLGVNQALGYSQFADTDSRAFYMANRTASNVYNGWRNSVKSVTGTTVSSTPVNLNTYIGSLNQNGSPLFYTTKECAFASIGDGLTDTEAANLYTAVQAYQTTLGRQV